MQGGGIQQKCCGPSPSWGCLESDRSCVCLLSACWCECSGVLRWGCCRCIALADGEKDVSSAPLLSRCAFAVGSRWRAHAQVVFCCLRFPLRALSCVGCLLTVCRPQDGLGRNAVRHLATRRHARDGVLQESALWADFQRLCGQTIVSATCAAARSHEASLLSHARPSHRWRTAGRALVYSKATMPSPRLPPLCVKADAPNGARPENRRRAPWRRQGRALTH